MSDPNKTKPLNERTVEEIKVLDCRHYIATNCGRLEREVFDELLDRARRLEVVEQELNELRKIISNLSAECGESCASDYKVIVEDRDKWRKNAKQAEAILLKLADGDAPLGEILFREQPSKEAWEKVRDILIDIDVLVARIKNREENK